MTENGQVDVYGGVDTHRDVHMAAAVTLPVGSWARRRSEPTRPAMSR